MRSAANRRAVAHACAVGDEAFDVGELRQRDLALGDHVGAADIEVVAAAAREIFELPAGAVVAEVELEAAPREPVEQRLVELPALLGERDVALAHQRERHRGRDQVAVLGRRPFVVERVGELRARLDVHHQRRAALHQRDLRAAGVEILRDVVAAVAGADHDARACRSSPRRRGTGSRAAPRRRNFSATEYPECSGCR